MTIVLKSNVSAPQTVIPDLGIVIPGSGGSETLTSAEDLLAASQSEDLRALVVDDAYGAGSSTIILNDGVSDVPQVDALDFLDDTGHPAGGGITPLEHEALDTLTHGLAEDSFIEVIRTDGRVTGVKVWQGDATDTTLIRETTVTRTAGQVSTVATTQYDGVGTATKTLTGTITREGGRVSTIDLEVS